MVALVRTVAYLGLEAREVEVQCHVGPGLPRFNVVGLADKAVSESRERVQAALSAMGLAMPPKRITVNLSPADLPKDGSHYDLPIALALLAAMGVTDAEQLGDWIAVGELALDGRVVASPGVLIAALYASESGTGLICPAEQGPEARWASGVPVLAPRDLMSLLGHLKGSLVLPEPARGAVAEAVSGNDLRQVKGQETAKRALEIAAAGGHNLLTISTSRPLHSTISGISRCDGIWQLLDGRGRLRLEKGQVNDRLQRCLCRIRPNSRHPQECPRHPNYASTSCIKEISPGTF